MLEQGQLPSREKLQEYYATFRNHFSPEKLLQLDGEELLNTIHAHGNRDSLVYWLEFKNDEEFPEFFGSIAGGSALKFGIFELKFDCDPARVRIHAVPDQLGKRVHGFGAGLPRHEIFFYLGRMPASAAR